MPLTACVYLHSKFSGGLRKTHLFCKSTYQAFKILLGYLYGASDHR